MVERGADLHRLLPISGSRACGRSPAFGFLVLAFALLLTGCAGLPQTFRQSLTVVVPHQVDFAELDYYAKRSRAAYTSSSEIRRDFPLVSRVTTVSSVDVLYFLETDQGQRMQTLTIRGTAAKPNVWQDLEIELILDPNSGVPLHRGFRDDAIAVYADLKPYIRKGYSVRVTGHSLGGAVAAIVAYYLLEDGHDVSRVVTFGGPKVTNAVGKAKAESSVHVTRVVLNRDVVPMIPPSGFLSGALGGYQHFGPEIILHDGPQYVYLPDHDANRLSIGEFWRNITDFSTEDHHMINYLNNIDDKVRNGAIQVPYFGLLELAGNNAGQPARPGR